jgi:hypothetical protein
VTVAPPIFCSGSQIARRQRHLCGVDVMITIFYDFRQFTAKNGVFFKNQRYYQICAFLSFVLSQKRQFFAKFSDKNIFKIITAVPCFCCRCRDFLAWRQPEK